MARCYLDQITPICDVIITREMFVYQNGLVFVSVSENYEVLLKKKFWMDKGENNEELFNAILKPHDGYANTL